MIQRATATLFDDAVAETVLSRAQAEQVLADLRRALRHSLRNGGRYQVSVPGGPTLAVHVAMSEALGVRQ